MGKTRLREEALLPEEARQANRRRQPTYTSCTPTRWSRGSPPRPRGPSPQSRLSPSSASLSGGVVTTSAIAGSPEPLCPHSATQSVVPPPVPLPFPAGILTDVHVRLSRRSRSPHPRDNAPASPLHLALSPGSPAPCLAKCADPSGRRLIRLENGAQGEQRQDGTVMGSQRRRHPHRLR